MILKRLSKDTIVYGGGDLIGKLIAFATFPMIARAVSPEVFGSLELVNTFVSLLGLIINCGLNNALQRHYWDEGMCKDDKQAVVSTGLLILSILSSFVLIVGLLAYPLIIEFFKNNGVELSFISVLSALSLVGLLQLNAYIQDVTRLHFAPTKFLLLSFLSKILSAFFSILLVVNLNLGIEGYLSANAVVLFLVLPVGLYLIKSDIKWTINTNWARTLLSFGYPFIFAGLGHFLLNATDRWMLAKMSSIAEVGLFSIALRFSSVIIFVSSAFAQAWSPYAIKIKTDFPDKYREVYSNIFLVLLYLMLIIGGGFALFSGEIIGFMLTKDYHGSEGILALLIFSVILQTTTQITAVGISIEKKSFIFTRLAWVAVALNIFMNYFLIPRYGAFGAAFATLTCNLVLTVLYCYYTQKLHPIPFNFKAIALMMTLGTGILYASLSLRSLTLDWYLVFIKLGLGVACMVVVSPFLPFKELKNVG